MSGGLAPSKSTVYVSNLPFSLTNSDLHKEWAEGSLLQLCFGELSADNKNKILEKHGLSRINRGIEFVESEIFSKYGTVVKVTVLRDKDSRKSKGVAFVLFLDRESAHNCTRALNNKQLFGRTVKASIAVDNGRASEFIRRRNYTDKSRCYECGEYGHLSYACPKNMLGEREPPKKKEKKKKKKISEPEEIEEEEEEESEDEGEDPALDSLSQAIAVQQAKIEEEELRRKQTADAANECSTSELSKRPRIKKSAYFSDEEELSD